MGDYYSKALEPDLIIPGVHLPLTNQLSNNDRLRLLFNNDCKSNEDQIRWVAESTICVGKIIGVSKKTPDVLKNIQDLFVKNVIPNKELLPSDYKYFGSQSNKHNLPLFLTCNPFYASALSLGKNGTLEVNSKITKDDDKTWFSKLVETLDDSYIRPNAKFDEKMNLISIKADNAKVEKTEEQLCDALMFLLLFYAEVIHAIIHVYHFYLSVGLADSTQHSKIQTAWASQYFEDVFVKYLEVKMLLFNVKGALTGGVFRSDRDQVLGICREIFCLWGTFKTAEQYIDEFLLVSLGKNKKGVLLELFKHVKLIGPFSKALLKEFAKINNGKELESTNKSLTQFYKNSGEGVSSLHSRIFQVGLN